MTEFKESGITMVLVTHSINSVITLCDRAMWIDNHTIRMIGQPLEIAASYCKASGVDFDPSAYEQAQPQVENSMV
jgi:lipopolysaccharide transport system ATP-binding protein